MENDKSPIFSHKFLVFGIILLACSLIVFIFFPDLYWTLPALSGAGVFALVAPLARLSQTNPWWQKYSLLVGGLGFMALWLYGFIVPPVRYPYAHLIIGIVFILLWIFRRKKFVINLTRNSMDSNQKNSLYVVSAAVAVILLAGLGYFGWAKKSTPVAQPATPPTTQQPEEPFTYTKNDQLFNVTKKEFSVADQFSAAALFSQSQECRANKTEQYYKDLLSKYTGIDKSLEYRFQYQGPTQDSGSWAVTVIPNKLGYANIDDFKKDFDICSAGGGLYPSLVSDKYLLFTSSCGSGFDDGSGKPHGCDLVSEAVEPTIKLQSSPITTVAETTDWQTYKNDTYGYEVKYPDNWQVGGIDREVKIMEVDGQDWSGSISVLDKSLAEAEAALPLLSVPGRKIDSRTNVTINGINWVKLVVEESQIAQLTYYKGKTYVVAYSTLNGSVSTQVVSTFKFIK